MRKKLLSILALTILVTSTLVGCNGESSTPSTLTILSITEGTVLVMKAGTDSWAEAEVGMSLGVGDTIKTSDASGAQITFFDGSTVGLEAGTQIEITSLDSSADTGATTITLMQTIGTTISRVTKLLDPASSYNVETPTGVAAVRGSILLVRIMEDGTVLITNLEGDIWAIWQGVELQIPEGRTCVIRLGQPPELIPLNELSLAVNDSAITDEDTSVTVAAPGVLDNDSGLIVGDTLAVTAVDTGATVGTVTAWDPDGSFTYDPDGQFEYLPAGNSTMDSFTYMLSDDYGVTDTATVTITINGVNDAPTDISLDNSSVAENQNYGTAVGDFSTTDPDAGDTFTYSLVSGDGDDGNAWFMIVGSQLQAAAVFNYETRNSYSIRVRTTDSGALYYEEAFIISVTNVNDPPVAVDDSDTTPEDIPVTIDVLNNDSDSDGDMLTVDSVTQGTNGSVTNNGSDVTYTPDPGFNNTDSFTYTISDGNGGTDTATVTVAVTVVETLASINTQIHTGPTASIYIWDDTANQWATDEATGQPVNGSNHTTPSIIAVAGGHYYYVWVEAPETWYDVTGYPEGWEVISCLDFLDLEVAAAYGYAASENSYSITFEAPYLQN
jgi:VCBS repeat-containing protein